MKKIFIFLIFLIGIDCDYQKDIKIKEQKASFEEMKPLYNYMIKMIDETRESCKSLKEVRKCYNYLSNKLQEFCNLLNKSCDLVSLKKIIDSYFAISFSPKLKQLIIKLVKFVPDKVNMKKFKNYKNTLRRLSDIKIIDRSTLCYYIMQFFHLDEKGCYFEF